MHLFLHTSRVLSVTQDQTTKSHLMLRLLEATPPRRGPSSQTQAQRSHLHLAPHL
jgi:hypothetical protein